VLFKRAQIAVKTKTFPALMSCLQSRLPVAKPPQAALGQECKHAWDALLGREHSCLVHDLAT